MQILRIRKYARPVRKLLRDDIGEYNTMRVKEAVKTGKGLKKATNKEECKVIIPSLEEEDGSFVNVSTPKHMMQQSKLSVKPIFFNEGGSKSKCMA